jgi:hypothetical protein
MAYQFVEDGFDRRWALNGVYTQGNLSDEPYSESFITFDDSTPPAGYRPMDYHTVYGAVSALIKKDESNWQLWNLATMPDYSNRLTVVDPTNTIAHSEGSLSTGDTVEVQIVPTAFSMAVLGMQGAMTRPCSGDMTIKYSDWVGTLWICDNSTPITLTLDNDGSPWGGDVIKHLPGYITAVGTGTVTVTADAGQELNGVLSGSIELTPFIRYTLMRHDYKYVLLA